MINNSHSDLGIWYKTSQESKYLRDNEKLYLKFTLLTGVRKEEAIKSFNLIINLANTGKLGEYFNEELNTLEHFKMLDTNKNSIFLRQTKKLFISVISPDLLNEVARSKEVSYMAIRKRFTRNKQTIRIKELRSYFATYLRHHGIISEEVDMLQGRIEKTVFARHYLKVEDMKKLSNQVLVIVSTIERDLLA